MDFLEQEIARKKALAEEARKTCANAAGSIGSTRFIRKGVAAAQADEALGTAAVDTTKGENIKLASPINRDSLKEVKESPEMSLSGKKRAVDGGASNGEEEEAVSPRKKAKKRLIFDKDVKYSTTEGLSDEKVIYKFFRCLLDTWETELEQMPDRDLRSRTGRDLVGRVAQCKEHIKPLFKQCKMSRVPQDILTKLRSVVEHCESGNFRAAHDDYILIAIGDAQWPMGLDRVGIHDRKAREGISSSNVSHVMQNEMQRKYLHSVKRLLTYCQKLRPDVPPSMKVQ